ncbi:unnamed protein product, partial [marine sediment metagenome]
LEGFLPNKDMVTIRLNDYKKTKKDIPCGV